MNRCVENLHIPIDKLYIDGTSYEYSGEYIPYDCIIRGDDLIPEIACASILAKTYRDEYIKKLFSENSEELEDYGIETNMGYGTKRHMDALKKKGFTRFHRKTFCKKLFPSNYLSGSDGYVLDVKQNHLILKKKYKKIEIISHKKEHSKILLQYLKHNKEKPKIELYPNSSWIKLIEKNPTLFKKFSYSIKKNHQQKIVAKLFNKKINKFIDKINKILKKKRYY